MVRIANYARKSIYSDKSDSTVVQYNLSEEYCKSHYPEYELIRYEDEGFTGANTQRPGYSSLVEDIKNKNIDVVMCYKIDRISRDVRDFSNFFNLCAENGVDFVSIKEQIDTSTPLGRAMMYICSVFAQMERETIAERVKDNMLELAKSGKWAGGRAPLGYKREKITLNGKMHTILVKNEEEIPFLNMIADTFLQGYSLGRLSKYFRENGIRTLQGSCFTGTQIYNILKNPCYCTADQEAYNYFKDLGCQMADPEDFNGKHGIMSYGRTVGGKSKKHYNNPPEKWIICAGLHEPMFTAKKWISIQNRFGLNVIDRTRKHHVGILKGIVKCSCGCTMRVQHKVDKTYNKTYDNYFCQKRNSLGKEYCAMPFTSVSSIDTAIIDILKKIKLDKSIIDNYIAPDITISKLCRKKADIQLDISAAENKIANITKTLATYQDSAAAKYLIAELEDLDKMITGYRYELRELSISSSNKLKSEMDKELKYKSICDLIDVIETADYNEVNAMLKAILKDCIYDGTELKITL